MHGSSQEEQAGIFVFPNVREHARRQNGVAFDREFFLRLRKTLVRQKPHALIDFHGSPAELMDVPGFIDPRKSNRISNIQIRGERGEERGDRI